ADHPGGRGDRGDAAAAGRAGRGRGRAPVHGHARRAQAGRVDGDLGGPRGVPRRRVGPDGGHAVRRVRSPRLSGGRAPDPVDRPLVMGILNVTPDSFSDGGVHDDVERARARTLEMIAEGVDVVDVGGESTRPGAAPTDPGAEQARVLPVIEAILEPCRAAGVRLSIDTRHESTARAALAAGATLLNDVSASLAGVAAQAGAGWIAMHMVGDPRTMQVSPRYDDVVAEVFGFLREQIG